MMIGLVSGGDFEGFGSQASLIEIFQNKIRFDNKL